MSISAQLLDLAVHTINSVGYLGIGLILFVVNIGVPIPSEAVLILAGTAVHAGTLQLWAILMIGVFVQTAGCIVAYRIGQYGGAPFVKRYGKYLLISHEDYAKTQRWFAKHGSRAIFISLLTPVVRAFIGIVAGTNKVDFKKFVIQCLLGSTIWTVLWVAIGWFLGDSWRAYYDYMHYVDYAVILLVVFFAVRFIWKKMRIAPQQAGRGKRP